MGLNRTTCQCQHENHQEIVVLSLQKITSGEIFLFRFVPQRKAETLKAIGRCASDPELSFNWFDAATLSKQVREA